MPLVARAFPSIISGSGSQAAACADPPGALLDSAAAAIAGLQAEQAGAMVILVPSLWMVAPLRQALRLRCARPGESWIPPPVATLSGHAAAADPGQLVRSRYTRLMAVAERLAQGGHRGAPAEPEGGDPAQRPGDQASGWAGRFQKAGALLDLIDAVQLARAIEAVAGGRIDAPAGGRIDPAGHGIRADAAGGSTADYLQTLAVSASLHHDNLLGLDLRLLAAIADAVADPSDPVPVEARQWRALLSQWQAARPTVVRVGLQPLRLGPAAAGAAGAAVDDKDDRVLRAFLARDESLRVVDLHPEPAPFQLLEPVVCAAWPEVHRGAPAVPIGQRRTATPSSAPPACPVLHARTREEEAALAAQWVHGQLAAGAQSLAILVMDRWLARRTRAMLERSRILIDDREGWALSTTVAASLVMAWLDYCMQPDERPHPGARSALALNSLLDSAFTTHPAAPALLSLGRWRLRGRGVPAQAASAARDAAALEAQVAAAAARQRRCASVREHLEGLRSLLGLLGAMQALQQDEAGRQVLALLDSLPTQAAAACRLDQFRALLGFALEGQRFHDGSIESPVMMIGLVHAIAGRYDAVLVLGANDGKLPAAGALPPGITEALMAPLGFKSIAQQAVEQTTALAWILASAGRWAMTCRTEAGDGSLPSQLVERLAAVLELDLANLQAKVQPRLLPQQAAGLADHPADGLAGQLADQWPMPRPACPVVRMPQEVAVRAIERLVACPYEFLVTDVWQLADRDEPVEAPGKRELGNLVHEVLLRFHNHVEAPPANDDSMIRLLFELTEAVIGDTPALRWARLVHLQEWYARIPDYVRQFRQDHADGWCFQDGEKRISGAIRYPVAAAGENGPAAWRELGIRGKYDRLDQRGQSLRIVDYKLQDGGRTRRKAADPDEAAQLMLYSWLTQADEAAYLAIDRRGVELAALDPPPAQALPQWQARVVAYLGRIADGEPLRALGSHCDRCQTRGVCRQGHWRDD